MGPISPYSIQPHPCFHARVFADFQSVCKRDDPETPLQCFQSCPRRALPPSPTLADQSPTSSALRNDSDVSPTSAFTPPTTRSLLFLRDSPTPPPVEDLLLASPFQFLSTNPLHSLLPEDDLSLSSWHYQIETDLSNSDDEAQFFLQAQDVDTAAQALSEFVLAIYSGQNDLSRQRKAELRVKIHPGASIAGMFFRNNMTFIV
jgi:hypothetical protein